MTLSIKNDSFRDKSANRVMGAVNIESENRNKETLPIATTTPVDINLRLGSMITTSDCIVTEPQQCQTKPGRKLKRAQRPFSKKENGTERG